MGLLRDLRKAGITAQQIIDLVNGKSSPQSMPTFAIGPTPPPRDGSSVVWVEVTGNATGGGVYEGTYAAAAPLAPYLDKATNVNANVFANFDWPTSSTSGTGPEPGECYIFNAAEEDQGTHYLTTGTPVATKFIGVFLGYEKSDGKPCFGINGLDWYLCE
jgi:hypothetical protein